MATLTSEQERELVKLFVFRPYRIVFAAIHPQSGDVTFHADATRHRMNDLVRKGYAIVQAKRS